MKKQVMRVISAFLCAAFLFGAAVPDLGAQTQGQPQNPPQKPPDNPAPAQPGKAPGPAKKVVEEIVARVNNEIITRSEYERARQLMRSELEGDCREAAQKNPTACTAEMLHKALEERDKDVLRDLVDNSLLVQRGKDLGINVEPEVVKQLDSVRLGNNLPDLEALEREVEKTGIVWEDYKNNIRSRLLTQEVIYREVQPTIVSKISDDDLKKFYDEHKAEFHRPEQVVISEILVSTEAKPETELPALEQKAKTLLDRVKKGEDFNELAKRFSDGTTAKQGGNLGTFERGQLSKEFEAQVFKMKRGDTTDVIRTRTGFMVLKVEQRYDAGLQPLEKVENEIRQQLYYKQLQPAAREYLTKLRQESYVMIKAGYVDTAGSSSAPIQEVQPVSEDSKDKKKKETKEQKEKKEATDKKGKKPPVGSD